MNKPALLSLVLLLCAVWVVAQQHPSQSSGQTSSQTSSAHNSKQTKVEGCLSGSEGNYTLTDKSGTKYQLSGDTAKLKDHVGHEVQVTGTMTASANGAAGSQSTSGGAGTQTIDVTSMKHISPTCSSR
jgi:hypothetical protein